MATIDTSIYGNIKPVQIEDPLNRFARQQEASVNMLKMQEMQQAVQDRNMLRQIDPSDPEYLNKVTRVNPKLGAELGKSRLEADEKRLKLAGDSTKMYMDVLPTISNPQQMAELTVAQYNDPNLGPVLKRIRPLEQALSTIPTDPQGFEMYKQKVAMGMKDFYTHTTLSESQKQDFSIKRERLQKDFDPVLQAKISSAKEYGQTLGKNKAVAEQALPNALQTAEEGIRLIDEMVGKQEIKDASGKVIQKGTKPHPGFSSYVGATLTPGMRFMEGSDTASYEVRQKQIEGKAFLEAFQALKGGGSITEKEGEKGTQAIMRMNKASNEREYIAAARELQGILRTGMERSRAKAGQTSPVVPNAAPAAPRPSAPAGSENVIDFNSLK